MKALFAVACILVTAAAAIPSALYFPHMRELMSHAYITVEGKLATRYQVRYIKDEASPGTCLVLVSDELTGAFSITAVPRGSCDVRTFPRIAEEPAK